jgi:hypothetical protein
LEGGGWGKCSLLLVRTNAQQINQYMNQAQDFVLLDEYLKTPEHGEYKCEYLLPPFKEVLVLLLPVNALSR